MSPDLALPMSPEVATTIGAVLLMAVGIGGLVVPVLPGLACVLLGVLVWAVGHSGPAAWTVFAVACIIAAGGYVVQYLLPGRHLSRAGVPKRSSIIGAVCGVVGFFVVPVVGLFAGFVIGVVSAEYARLRRVDAAWASTKAALRATLMSVGIELLAAVVITVGWACAAIAMR